MKTAARIQNTNDIKLYFTSTLKQLWKWITADWIKNSNETKLN